MNLQSAQRFTNLLQKMLGEKSSAMMTSLSPVASSVFPLVDPLQGENRLLRGERLWYVGDTLNASIGQGGIVVTIGNPTGPGRNVVLTVITRAVLSMSTTTAPAAATIAAYAGPIGLLTGLNQANFSDGRVRAINTQWNVANCAPGAGNGNGAWSQQLGQTTAGAEVSVDFGCMPIILTPGQGFNFFLAWTVALTAVAPFSFGCAGYERGCDPNELLDQGTIF